MYGKIFSSIFDSTLVSEGGFLPTYILMSMITIADKDGIVDVAPKALFRRLGLLDEESKITVQDCYNAMQYLCAEDLQSRSPAQNGRRIIPISEIEEIEGNRGWLIVNYPYYRQKASKTELPGSSTERVRRYREKQRQRNGIETGSKREGNGHTDTDSDKKNAQNAIAFSRFWDRYPKRRDKRKAEKAFSKLNPDPQLLDRILDSIDAMAESPEWQKDNGQFIPYPSTFLNGKRWEDEIALTALNTDHGDEYPDL